MIQEFMGQDEQVTVEEETVEDSDSEEHQVVTNLLYPHFSCLKLVTSYHPSTLSPVHHSTLPTYPHMGPC